MRLSKVYSLGLIALCTLAIPASIQAAEQATFHLPFKAYWAGATLEPGDYQVALPAPSLNQSSFRVVGPSKTVFAFPQITDYHAAKIPSRLVLREIDGCYYVREFSSQAAGKSYTFATPRSHARQIAKAQDRSLPVLND